MKINWKRLGTTVGILIIPLLLTRCLITSVNKPATVVKSTQVTLTINGYDSNIPSQGNQTDRGVLCVMVPNDWGLVSATYTAQEKGQTLVHSGTLTSAQNWKDSATVTVPPPAGMKWIGMLSDSAYVYADTLFMVATVKLQVGTTLGTFPLGFLMTKNGTDLISHFADGWSDTLMGQNITVQAAGAVEEQITGAIPTAYSLGQNYPNPFNPSTTIEFALKERSDIHLAVYDAAGREVAVLAKGMREPGSYRLKFTPDRIASGVYFYRLQANGFTQTQKMVFAK